jgi:hypothetical protein
MPYHLDRQLRFEVHTASLELRARGLGLTGLLGETAPETLAPGSLEHFAAERYRIYSQLPMGPTLCVQLAHEPWRARAVRLLAPLTPAALGLPSDAEAASAQLCENVEVVVQHLELPSEEAAEEPVLAPA